MAKNKVSKRKMKSIISSICIVITFIITLYYGYIEYKGNQDNLGKDNNQLKYTVGNIENAENIDINNNKLNIVFFYVGQADSTFIKLKDKTMLIDAGNNEDGNNIVNYLKSIGINKIDYLIGTHADEDHIGGLDDVIKNLEVEKIYMPELGSDSKNFKNVIKQINNKNLKIETPEVGTIFDFADAKFEVMAQMKGENISKNNSSIVLKMEYGDTKYLFMGDAEKEVENSRKWEKVDVLKVGHHGSATSSTQKFLEQVSPKFAFIQVGKNNSYRLPNVHTIERLEKVGATVFRTDTNESSFWITSDGNSIETNEIQINLDGNNN